MKTFLNIAVLNTLRLLQSGAEILVDDFDPEAHAQQSVAQKAADAKHHAARMLHQTKVTLSDYPLHGSHLCPDCSSLCTQSGKICDGQYLRQSDCFGCLDFVRITDYLQSTCMWAQCSVCYSTHLLQSCFLSLASWFFSCCVTCQAFSLSCCATD